MAAPKRTGLGRGIGALIPTASTDDHAERPVDVFFPAAEEHSDLVAVPGARLASLSPDDIVPNPQQPRHEFRQEELEELIVSVREFGVLQPIVVRPPPPAGARLGAWAGATDIFVTPGYRFRAIDAMLTSGEAKPGDTALLIAFGAGLSYAGQVVRLPG